MKVQKTKQDRTKATDRKAGESKRTRPGRKTTSDEWKEKRKPKINWSETRAKRPLVPEISFS